MSIESLAIALHHSRATGSAKLVLIGIANHDGDGGSWPAVSTLAKYAGVDPRSVQRALGKLEQLGEIRRLVSQGGDHSTADDRRPNLYRFLLACPHDCDRSSQHRTARTKRVMLDPDMDGVTLASPLTLASPGDVGVTARGDTGVTQTTLLTKHSPALKETTSSTRAETNEEALERCPFRPTGQPHVWRNGVDECAHCGIRSDQYWDGKEVRNRAKEPAA